MTFKSLWTSSKGIPALVLIAAASYFLLIEHREHLFQWLPYLIIALCPLMHVFMHSGHGGHGGHGGGERHSPENAGSAESEGRLRSIEDGKRQNHHHGNH